MISIKYSIKVALSMINNYNRGINSEITTLMRLINEYRILNGAHPASIFDETSFGSINNADIHPASINYHPEIPNKNVLYFEKYINSKISYLELISITTNYVN